MRPSRRAMALVHAVLSSLAMTACGVTEAERAPVEAVSVTPGALELAAGATAGLDAQAVDADGNVLDDRRIVWATSNASVATVSDRGLVTAVAPGRADVAATAEGKSGVAAVTVVALPARVSSVRITPGELTLFVAQSAPLVATAYDPNGAPIEGRGVVWTTNNAGVAAVSQTGRVTGLIPGNAVITAVIEGRAGTASITVRLVPVARVSVSPASVEIAAGKSTTLEARVFDAAGNLLLGRPVTWSSSDTRIATVDQAGVVRGVRRGTVVVTATAEGKFGTATVRVD